MSPFFSIIIPTYNRSLFIREIVSKFIEQSFHDFELIIIDDGSTDNTSELVKSLTDPRIHYYYIDNSERAAARNHGSKKARGQYLNFFDSDDIPYSFHLSTAFDFIQKNQYPAWFHVGYKEVDENNETILEETNFTYDVEKRLIKTNFLGCNSVFIKREIFLENPFHEDRMLASSEDWELWLRVISRYKLLSCHQITYQMTNHSGRSLFNISPEKIEQRDLLMTDLLMKDSFFVKKYKKYLSMFIADRYTFFALVYALSKKHKEKARYYLYKSLSVYPLVVFRKRFWASIKHLL